MEPAVNRSASDVAPDDARAQNSPAVLAQPPADGFVRVATPENAMNDKPNNAGSPTQTLNIARGAFTDARDAVVSGYRTASDATDDFVHESPWKSIAFAVLGGVIVGMLAAR
ncbi:hypothetical protein BZM27_48075 [Paraburkholderia steynii]|uniref:DUF883 domain-containing protein n=1 Tax=Paraburkholderia steynii TaxID=1245441 RepID=A0A4R0X9Y2_9BURK|nr:hypothetical protein BZM27_48075 [Paraburkholderia steynii]